MDTQRSTVQDLYRVWIDFGRVFFFGFCFYRIFLSLQRQTLFYWVLPSFFFLSSASTDWWRSAQFNCFFLFHGFRFRFYRIAVNWVEFSQFRIHYYFSMFFLFIFKSFFRRTWLGFWLAQFISWCFLLDFNVVLPSFT